MPSVIRPRLPLLIPLAAALIAGCSNYAAPDTVARYDEAELHADELTELMSALAQPDVGYDPTDADGARNSISVWIRIEAVKQRLADDGISVTPEQVDEATVQMSSNVPGFTELSDGTRDYLVEAQAAFLAFFGDVQPPDENEIREFYERGPVDSGITCVAHILVATEGEANDVLAELEAGADFAELAAERSLDTGSGAAGGALPCAPTSSFSETYVPPFVDAALAAEFGVPTPPTESDFGFHVILLRPFDEVRAELEAVLTPQEFAIARSIERADVFVDPRYGALDGGVVVPLT